MERGYAIYLCSSIRVCLIHITICDNVPWPWATYYLVLVEGKFEIAELLICRWALADRLLSGSRCVSSIVRVVCSTSWNVTMRSCNTAFLFVILSCNVASVFVLLVSNLLVSYLALFTNICVYFGSNFLVCLPYLVDLYFLCDEITL
jgi:hypothetical protein